MLRYRCYPHITHRLLLSQNNHLPFRSTVTSNIHPAVLVLRNTHGSEALRSRTVIHVRIPEDISPRMRAVQGRFWPESMGTVRKGDLDDLVSNRRTAIPGPVNGDVHASEIPIESRVKRRRVSWESKTRRYTPYHTRIIRESGVGLQDKLITHCKLFVGDGFWVEDGVASRVPIPVCVFFGGVTQVVDLISWV